MNLENRRMVAKAAVITKYFGRGKRYMNEKLEFVKKVGRNFCAFVLALGILTTSGPAIVPRVEAVEYGLKFVLNNSANYDVKTKGTTQLISAADEAITIKATLPPDYTLPPEKAAFRVLTSVVDSQGDKVMQEVTDHFEILGANTTYTLKPVPEKIALDYENGPATREYTMEANYTANGVVEGEGSFEMSGTDPDTGDWSVFDANLTAKSLSSLGLIEDTGLTIEFNKSEGYKGKITKAYGFLATDFDVGSNTIASISPIDTTSNEYALTVRNTNNQRSHNFKVSFNSNGKILKDATTFTISVSFQKPSYDPLVLQMYTAKGAIATDRVSLGAGKNAAVMEDGKTQYFTLTGGDTDLQNIKYPIRVETQAFRYNGTLGIEWHWRPDEGYEAYGSTLEWASPSKVMTITEPDIDVPGKLLANFYYEPTVGDRVYLNRRYDDSFTDDELATLAAIPIKILGRGVQPSVRLASEDYADYYTENGGIKTKKEHVNYTTDEQKFNLNLRMDTYDGSVAYDIYNPLEPQEAPYQLSPFRFDGIMDFGTSRNAAKSVKITQSTGQGAVSLLIDGREYEWGTEFTPDRTSISDTCNKTFTLLPKAEGNVRLQFQFFDTQGNLMPNIAQRPINISISDHKPNDNAYLSKLDMTGTLAQGDEYAAQRDLYGQMYPSGFFDFGFSKTTLSYKDIVVPNVVEKIQLTPQYEETKNRNAVRVIMRNAPEDLLYPNRAGEKKTTAEIPLGEGVPTEIIFRCTAQDGSQQDYVLVVTRASKSTETDLENIIVRPEKDSPEEDYYQLEPGEFDPDWPSYIVHVPYGPVNANGKRTVYLEAVAKDAWATKMEITQNPPKSTTFLSRLTNLFKQKKGDDIELRYEVKSDGTVENQTVVKIDVTAEDGTMRPEPYTVTIIRDDPSEDDTIKAPEVSYWLKADRRTEKEAELDQSFLPEEKEIFTKLVEYSTNRVKIKITPNDYRAVKVTVSVEGTSISKTENVRYSGQDALPLEFDFSGDEVKFPENNILRFKVVVSPESDLVNPPLTTPVPYYINVERQEPSRDLTADVSLQNMLTNAAIDFGYNNVVDDYPVKEIEYTPGDMKVLVKVTPNDSKTTVEVQGNTPRPDGTAISLTAGSTTTVKIVLTAEDGSQRNITIPLKYKGPSKNCYLSNLTAGGFKFLPDPTIFIKDKTSYKIEIPKGTASFPVTPTLLKDGSDKDSSNAVITVNGATVADGEAYTYTPTDKSGKISVVVTAQDGKSKRTYTINYKNWNLMTPSDENTLKDLKVDYGDLQPVFEPGTQEYEVYVKPDAMSIKLFPKLKDPDGQIRVVAGKVLTEFDGAYSVSLMDDETDIQIYVWSEKDIVDAGINSNTDAATTAPSGEAAGTGTNTDMRLNKANAREYELHVYRNDEEKIGNLKPITAEMVDFVTADPIVIDITKYPIISADVFNTLKTDYVDKSILFKGNDYTLQVFGEDIDGLVPHTDSFDLRFSFFTPDQDKIEDILDDIGNNDRVDPVYYYFNQHGALPAEMLLTVNLGRHYRNENLYWNYYNPDRERIDYYGYVRTNATGTFSVPISHFSTYLTTEDKIRGAENKSEEYGNPELSPEQENLNAPASANKSIPNTGAGVSG